MVRVGARIRSKRKALGLSGRKFAERAYVSPSFLSDIELGKTEPSMDTLRKIAFALDCTLAELFAEDRLAQPGSARKGQVGGESAFSEKATYAEKEDWIELPILDSAAVAGVGDDAAGMLEFYGEATETVILSRAYVGTVSSEPDKKPFVVIVKGDSMVEANIPDGAEVVINPAEEIRDADPVFVCYGPGSNWAVRWVYWHRNDTIELRSASLKYPPKIFIREDLEKGLFRLIGKVVRVTVSPKRGE